MSAEAAWYYAKGQQQVGPVTLEELVRQLPSVGGPKAMVWGPGLDNWAEAKSVPEVVAAVKFQQNMRSAGSAGSPPPTPRRSDEIDYKIFGSEMQYVEITLDPGEMVIAEAGAMMYMTSAIKMETVFGDPSAGQQGLFGKLKAAGKRVMTGESMFMTTFTNMGDGDEVVAFAAPYPGKIVPMDLAALRGELICQKDSFLCGARGVQIGIAFQRRFGVGLFGGEGFIMQRLTGDGLAMVHAGGTLMKRTLNTGETLKLDTGCLVAMTASVDYDIETVGGVKNSLFGGEGLFLVRLTGPGTVWCQSLPFSRLAGRMMAASGGGREEGSVLGGLGRLIGGDTE